MHKEEQGVLRDSALERVSHHMRKAFSLNKSEMGDLKSTVTKIKRERHRSFSNITKQQQIFLRKQSRIIPAVRLQTLARKKSSSDSLSQSVNCDTSADAKTMKAFPILPPISHQDICPAKEKTSVDGLGYQNELNTLNQSLHNVRLFLSRSLPEIADGSDIDDPDPQKLPSSTGDSSPTRNLSRCLKKDEDDIEACQSHSRDVVNALTNIEIDTKVKHETKNIISGVNIISQVGLHCENCDVKHTRSATERREPFPCSSLISNEIGVQWEQTCPQKGSWSETSGSRKQGKLPRRESNDAYRTRTWSKDSDVFSSCASAKGDMESIGKSQLALRRWSKIRKSLKYATLANKSDEVKYLEKLYREIRGCRYIRKHPKQELEDEVKEVESLASVEMEQREHHHHCPCYFCEKSQLSLN